MNKDVYRTPTRLTAMRTRRKMVHHAASGITGFHQLIIVAAAESSEIRYICQLQIARHVRVLHAHGCLRKELPVARVTAYRIKEKKE